MRIIYFWDQDNDDPIGLNVLRACVSLLCAFFYCGECFEIVYCKSEIEGNFRTPRSSLPPPPSSNSEVYCLTKKKRENKSERREQSKAKELNKRGEKQRQKEAEFTNPESDL